MLSDNRKPPYLSLPKKERLKYWNEELQKVYLSSIRRADEWSYKTFEDYIHWMTDGNLDFAAAVIPYQLGVKNGFISKKKVEEVYKANQEIKSILDAVSTLPILVNSIENPFNCWKLLKLYIPQHKSEIRLSAMVTKV